MSVFTIKQGDTRPKLVAVLYDKFGTPSQTPIDLSSATQVQFVMRNAGENDPAAPKVKRFCSIADPVAGVVIYTWQDGDTSIVGKFNAEFEITWSDGGIETVPNDGYFEIKITDDLG